MERFSWLALGLLALAAGCGGGGPAADAGDSAPADTGSADTGSADTGSADTGSADASVDATDSSTADAAVDGDVPADATVDAVVDATVDAVVDATVDATPDATARCAIDCDCPQGDRCVAGACRVAARPFYCCDSPGCPEGSACTNRAGFAGTCPATLTDCAAGGGVCVVQFSTCPRGFRLDTSVSCGAVRSLQCCAKD